MAEFATMSSGGFPYGLNWSKNPEAISDGELVQAEQCEYDHADGSLRTVEGVTIKLDIGMSVDTLFYDHTHDLFLFSSGTNLYKTDLYTYTLLGPLTGSSKPVYCNYGGVIIIASGNLLQALTGANTLTTLSGSPPVSNYVTSRQGRLVAFSIASDVVNYSAIGDYTSWTNVATDKSSAQFVDVGYKDPGNIIAIDFLAQVMIVYKQYGRAYQIVGEPSDSNFSVLAVSQTASCLSLRATCNVDGISGYLGQAGLMAFTPVNAYSDIEPTELGLNINAWIAKNIDENCQMWHVQPKKQVWIKTQNDNRVYLYHYIARYSDGRGAFTCRTFTNQLHDVCAVKSSVYVACGNKIGILDGTTDLDDSVQIQTAITGNNKLTQKHSILVMNRNFVSYNIIDGYGTIKCGKKPKNVIFTSNSPDIYGNIEDISDNGNPIYTDAYTRSYKVGGGSNKSVQLSVLVQKGSIAIRQFDYQFLEV